MARSLTEIVVFLASPGDLTRERAAVRRAAAEVNTVTGDHEGFHLVVKGWDTHTRPAATRKGRAQDAIFEQIGRFDLFLGLMGARAGQPTGKAASGTIEEYQEAYRQWKRKRVHKPSVMFYFRQSVSAEIDALDGDQIKTVQAFKKRVFQQGLAAHYTSVPALETALRTHLTHEARAILARRAGTSTKRPAPAPTAGTTSKPAPRTPRPRKTALPKPRKKPAVPRIKAPRVPAPITDATRRTFSHATLNAIRRAFADGRQDFNRKNPHLKMSVRKDGDDAFVCHVMHDEQPLVVARLAVEEGSLYAWSLTFGLIDGIAHLPYQMAGIPEHVPVQASLPLTEHDGVLAYTLRQFPNTGLRYVGPPTSDPHDIADHFFQRIVRASTDALHNRQRWGFL